MLMEEGWKWVALKITQFRHIYLIKEIKKIKELKEMGLANGPSYEP